MIGREGIERVLNPGLCSEVMPWAAVLGLIILINCSAACGATLQKVPEGIWNLDISSTQLNG